MKHAEQNDEVTLNYEGRVLGGEVFATSEDTGPISFKLGEGSVLPGIEKAVLGMLEGETKTVEILPLEAFGPHIPDLVHTVDRINLGVNTVPEVGMVVAMKMHKDGGEHSMPAEIKKIEGNKVTLDFNHPLAGKTLKYTLTASVITKSPSVKGAGCGCNTVFPAPSCNPDRCKCK